MFIYWWSNSNTLFLASNDRTSNFELNRAFTRFTKLLFELTRTSLFRTWNELERVHLLAIELEHPIFGLERLNIEFRTLFDPSLIVMSLVWTNISTQPFLHDYLGHKYKCTPNNKRIKIGFGYSRWRLLRCVSEEVLAIIGHKQRENESNHIVLLRALHILEFLSRTCVFKSLLFYP